MPGQDDLVPGIDHGLFRRTAEKIFGMAHEILVQRVLARHQHHGRFLLCPAHAPAPLQGGHDGARIAHQDADIQPADVDAQFQGAGADHGQQLARSHAGLDLAAFLGQESRAIGGDAARPRPGKAPGPQADQLGHAAGTAIDDGAQLARQRGPQQIDGRRGRALVGIEEDVMPCALRRAGLVHHHGRLAPGQQIEAGERRGQLAGIAHRGRAEYIGRRGAVMGGQPVEAAEHARHMRAEHAAVGVGLVHHDVGKPGQEGGPLLMVRQQGQMQHLGIADEHRGRVAADLAPEVVAGVAVVKGGRGPGLLGPACDQALQPGQLVLGQGLEREKIEGAGLAVAQVAFQYGQVVDQALAAGRGRGHHHGMPGADMVRGQGLMAVKAAQAAFLQRAPDGRRPGQAAFRVYGRTRGLAAMVPYLRPQFVRSQQGPDIFSDAHDGPPLRSWPRPPRHMPP